jgi:hypothetical protein
MKIFFGQVYIIPGVKFPFSHHFQLRLSREITSIVVPSDKFMKKYGRDYELMFNISAKDTIEDNEIRGPTVFKKTKDVEYTIFLPFMPISRQPDVPRSALTFLFKGVYTVLESLEIDSKAIKSLQSSLIDSICSDPMMFEQPKD